jgi:hypothetical protein
MPRPRRSSRRNYNRIDGPAADDGHEDDAPSSPSPPSSALESSDDDARGGRGTNSDDNSIAPSVDRMDDAPSSSSSKSLAAAVVGGGSSSGSGGGEDGDGNDNMIDVILMDGAQSKFVIRCDPNWRVSRFKEASANITRVPPRSQRLIHMGKLLDDSTTLRECGIREDGKIIHLFPKPNVVIGGGGGGATCETNDDGGGGIEDGGATTGTVTAAGVGGGGAHVPQIIIDEEEASRRSQILILSSQEIFEAQHRVKLFSFLLMIISSMELLTVMTLFVGNQGENEDGAGGELPPGNPTDIPPSHANDPDPYNNDMEMRTWQDSDYFDALISAFGLYVSLLGIKATTENTLRLARRYLLCLSVAGVCSNCYYYYLNVDAQSRQAEAHDQTIEGSALYATAFVGILLPLTVWMMCIIRAYQFQSLIREAEVEAEERTRGSYGGGGGENNEVVGVGGDTSRTPSYGSDDLELAMERGVTSVATLGLHPTVPLRAFA